MQHSSTSGSKLNISRVPDARQLRTPVDVLTLPVLRTALRARNDEVPEWLIRRLRLEGLLQCLGQRHEKGNHGSVSLYASSAPADLELVLRLRERERRFDELRVIVALNGGWVDPSRLRDSLIALTEPVSSEVNKLVAGAKDADERVERLAQTILREPSRGQFNKLIFGRLGPARATRAEREAVAWVLASLAFGRDPGWHDADPNATETPRVELFDRASGFDRARSDVVEGAGPLLPADVATEDLMRELVATGAFDITRVADAFRGASDDELQAAMSGARQVIELAGKLRGAIEHDFAGLGSLRPLDPDQVTALQVAILVRFVLLAPPGLD
jgi:hypothetical protein